MPEDKNVNFTDLLPPAAQDSRDERDLFARIIAAYVSNNKVSPSELPQLMQQVRDFLASMERKTTRTNIGLPLGAAQEPAVPIDESISQDHIICLEDGVPCKILKRYIRTRYGLTPEQYRRRWKLPENYPMVAPSVSQSRSEAAKKMRLGGAQARRKTA